MEKKRVLTVLRSGGDFRPEHVRALAVQVGWHTGNVDFQCLSDVNIHGISCIPLKHDWPGWWAKIELFREDLGGDFLFTDLDNVVLGPLDELFTGQYTTQRGDWNALMYVPPGGLPKVYEEFKHAPGEHIALNQPTGISGKAFGDAGFVAARVQGQYWEDVVPGRVVNIVEMIRPTPLGPRWKRIPADAHVILCGGPDRRPWKLPMFRGMYPW
jgi:hypothetical protein